MQTKIIGGGVQSPGVEVAIDPTFMAARVAAKPIEYAQFGQVLGHYRLFGTTSVLVFAANSNLASIRWTDASRYFVLKRCSASFAITTAGSVQLRFDPLFLFVARAYTARDVTNATSILPSGSMNKMRTSMGTTLVASADVSNLAAGLSGGTKTVDTQPIGHCGLSGTGPILGLGTGAPKQDLYKLDMADGAHPVVLATNEGLLLQWGATALGGTYVGAVSVEWVWAEVVVF